MKTKKHMVEVEIPTGKFCDGCEFLISGMNVCGFFDHCIGDCGGNPNRNYECIEKFGIEESDADL